MDLRPSCPAFRVGDVRRAPRSTPYPRGPTGALRPSAARRGTAHGHYVDTAPPKALATVNLMSLFGAPSAARQARRTLRRRRGDLVPASRRLAEALRRVGAGPAAVRFYTEHVEADVVHEQVVRHDVAGGPGERTAAGGRCGLQHPRDHPSRRPPGGQAAQCLARGQHRAALQDTRHITCPRTPLPLLWRFRAEAAIRSVGARSRTSQRAASTSRNSHPQVPRDQTVNHLGGGQHDAAFGQVRHEPGDGEHAPDGHQLTHTPPPGDLT